ncbi:MAG: potassium transporter TrkG [Oscillospiraceae bacterium]|nr:potassium transporter TrkG [Oscillospiraceae bacterium]
MKRLSATKIFAIVYFLIIILGGVLLTLPVSSGTGNSTNFLDACFTATSATCVTGLSVFNTYEYWSLFGQIVILCLIQIGGVGFMTFAVTLVTVLKKKLSITNRTLMQQSVSAPTIGEIVSLTKVIVFGTLTFEALGALAYSFFYVPVLGVLRGIYFSVFHSVSAFCNAGFDLMGITDEESLISVQGNIYFNIVTMLLIIIGGLGFFVWVDLWQSKFKFKLMRLHTKIVVTVSLFLILFGAVLIFLLETKAFQGMSFGKKVLLSLFQSVTARTAGFESVNIADMTQASQMIIILLMLVGGSPGSTAGGFKTTTLGILFFNLISTVRKKTDVECFGRSVPAPVVKTVLTIFVIYVILTTGSAIAISRVENIPMLSAMFESSSALATVGLSLDLTSGLGVVSKFILMGLMFAGRVGPLTIFMAFSPDKFSNVSRLPNEEVRVG